MEEIIMVKNEEGRTFDKMKIAIAIRDSTYNDKLSCSLISNEIINNCESCTLKGICHGIEALAEDYKEKTTKVVNSFSFGSL